MKGPNKAKLDELKILNEMIINVSRLEDVDEICHSIAKTVHRLNPDSVVATSLYDYDVEGIRVRSIVGLGKNTKRVIKTLKRDPKDIVFNPRKLGRAQKYYTTGKMHQVENGLAELMAGTVPEKLCKMAEKAMKIESVHTVGFAMGEEARGGVIIFVPKGRSLLYGKTIETMVGHLTEVIHRRQANEELKKSKRVLEEYLNIAAEIVISLNEKGQITLINDSGCKLLGYEKGELIGKDWFETCIPEEAVEEIRGIFNNIMEGNADSVKRFENQVMTRNGEKKTLLWHNTNIVDGNQIIGTLSSGEDITQRKESEQALEESEKLYRNLFETMTQAVVYQDAEGKIISANPAAERILGLSVGQMLGRESHDPRWKTIREDGSDFPGEEHPAMVALETGQKVSDVIMGVFNPEDDEYRWLNVNATPEFEEGAEVPYRVYATLEDITEVKKAEKALKESESLKSAIINSSQDCIKLLDLDGKLEFMNKGGQELLEIEDLNSVLGSDWTMFWEGEDRENAIKAIERAKGGEVDIFEGYCPSQTGKPKCWSIIVSPIINDEGDVEKILAVSRDVTVRKMAQQSREDNEKRLKEAQRLANIGNWSWNPETNEVFLSDEMYNIIGLEKCEESLIFSNHEKHYTPESWNDFIKTVEESRKSGESYEVELEIIREGRQNRYVLARGEPIKDQSGKTKEIQGTLQDITDRKNAEMELRKREEEKSWILGGMLNAFVIFESVFDDNGDFISYRFVYINDSFEKITGVTLDEVRGKTVHEVWPEIQPEWIKRYGEVAVTGKPQTFELFHAPTDNFYSCNVFRPYENKEKFCVIFDDITEKVESQDEITRSLKEKEIMLKEIHHRVKNNLQVISSMLSLQAKVVKDEKSRDALIQMKQRVHSMSSVHELLYKSENLTEIPLKNHIEEITKPLFAIYRKSSNDIVMKVTSDDIRVSIEKAIPMGLVLNELISNSMKYAFEDRMKGEISITLKEEANQLTITVKDDGVGMSKEEFLNKTDTLGLNLVELLIEQLNGEVQMFNGTGTTFEIRVPK